MSDALDRPLAWRGQWCPKCRESHWCQLCYEDLDHWQTVPVVLVHKNLLAVVCSGCALDTEGLAGAVMADGFSGLEEIGELADMMLASEADDTEERGNT